MNRRQALTFTTAVLATALTGCAATGPQYSQASLPPIPEGLGRIVLYYPFKLFGADLAPQVQINDTQYGVLNTGGFMVIDLPPGPPPGAQNLRLWRPSRIAGVPGFVKEQGIQVAPGMTSYARFRLRWGTGAGSYMLNGNMVNFTVPIWQLAQVREAEALGELAHLSHVRHARQARP